MQGERAQPIQQLKTRRSRGSEIWHLRVNPVNGHIGDGNEMKTYPSIRDIACARISEQPNWS
jgi:hypothetical protein